MGGGFVPRGRGGVSTREGAEGEFRTRGGGRRGVSTGEGEFCTDGAEGKFRTG